MVTDTFKVTIRPIH